MINFLDNIFKKNNEKSYTCHFLNNDLAFFTDKIACCCSGYTGFIYQSKPNNEVKIEWKRLLKERNKHIKQLKEGIIPKGCQGCYMLKPYKKEHPNKFKHLIFNTHIHCNCGCVYCSQIELTKGVITETPKKSDYYDLLPYIKELYKNKLLDTKELDVEFQGGDLSVLSEFESLVDLFIKNGVKLFQFTTNNIVFQPKILEGLNKFGGKLITSLDSGTPETYKKLKRVDKFYDTVNNLKEYKRLITNKDSEIIVKYIIVKGLNDNIDELTAFFDIISEIGIKSVILEINYRDILMFKNKPFIVPEHYYKLYEYAKLRAKECGIHLGIWEHTQKVLKDGKFGC